MRPIRIMAVVFALSLPAPAFAQEWIEYVDRAERFSEDGNRIPYELDADGNRFVRVRNLNGVC